MKSLENQKWPISTPDMERLSILFKRMFKCDGARLTSPLGETIFLIIGHNRNTKNDGGAWFNRHGKRCDWDYLQECCIASGESIGGLIKNAKYYKRLQSSSWEDFLAKRKSV